jgi:hypothetical protein
MNTIPATHDDSNGTTDPEFYAAGQRMARHATGPVTVAWRDDYNCPQVLTFADPWAAAQELQRIASRRAPLIAVSTPSAAAQS